MRRHILIIFLFCLAFPYKSNAQQRENVTDWAKRNGLESNYKAAIQRIVDGFAADRPGIDTVYFPAGVYYINPESFIDSPLVCGGSRKNSAVLVCNKRDIIFLGEGNNSIIRIGTFQGRYDDFHIFRIINSKNITFQKLTLDGNGMINNYNEQRHSIQIQISDSLLIDSISFIRSKGDGVQIIGDLIGDDKGLTQATNIVIQNCEFRNNGRSGIAVQRNVNKLTIRNCLFDGTSDQDIDFEPSRSENGNRIDLIQDVIISNNRFVKNHNSISVTLTSGKNIQLIGNYFENGCLTSAISLKDFFIIGNTFNRTNDNYALESNNRINLKGIVQNGLIQFNVIEGYKNKAASVGKETYFTVRIGTDSVRGAYDVYPNNIKMLNNQIVGNVEFRNLKRINFEGNDMFSIVKNTSDTNKAISYHSYDYTSFPIESISIISNRFFSYKRAIELTIKNPGVDNLLINSNNFYFTLTGESRCIYYNNGVTNTNIQAYHFQNNSLNNGAKIFTDQIRGFNPPW